MRLTGKKVEKEDVFSIRLNSDDFVARFRMEADQLPRVELASEEMQEVVYMLAIRIFPELNNKKGRKGLQRRGMAERFPA